jgi:SAM-dependent methyltransferase
MTAGPCHIYHMNSPSEPFAREPAAEAFRRVDAYLESELEARALGLALSWGWIDRLVGGPVMAADLTAALPPPAGRLMLSMLAVNQVVAVSSDRVALTGRFADDLALRDLLEARLWFAGTVAPDIHRHLPELLADIPAFMAQSAVFELFRYDRCFEVSEENLALTRRWVAYTTTLTRHEGDACWRRVDLSAARRLLDVGGNSGEFSRLARAAFPQLSATVFDLPVVCELGRRHLAGSGDDGRIEFFAGDLRHEDLPPGADCISFKSVLHDWPDEAALDFLDKAWRALPPGGRLIIFERGEIAGAGRRLSYAMVANLVFLPFFRDPSFYTAALTRLGFAAITTETITIDMDFHLITAIKPS